MLLSMNPKALYRMIEELRQQCRFGLLSFESLRLRLNDLNTERVFVETHAFLGHATMVSRLLWPSRPESTQRGELLRSELKLPDASPLRMSGTRSQIDRFDEAYEDWLITLPEAGYVDMNLMPSGTMLGSKEDVFQRSLDPNILTLNLRGIPIDLRQIAEALRTLEHATQGWLRNHNPW